jgi:drug/metabolite transporter (DMT)-like permease
VSTGGWIPSRYVGLAFILGSAFCFSTMGTVVKESYDQGGTATGLLAIRMLTASAVWVLLLNRRLLAFDWRSEGVRRLVAGTVAGVVVASLAEYAAYRHLPVALVVVILFMAPVWVALGQWVLTGRGVGPAGVVGLIVLAAGLVLLTQVRLASASLAGIGLALVASVGIGIFFTLSGQAIAEIGAVRSAAVVAVAAAAAAVPIALIDGTLAASFEPSVVGHGIVLGIVATVISMTLLLNGVLRLGAFPAAVVSAVEPVFAGLLAWMFLSETLAALQIAGAALVVAGTLFVQRRHDLPVEEQHPRSGRPLR